MLSISEVCSPVPRLFRSILCFCWSFSTNCAIGGLPVPCTSADPLDSTPFCLVPTRLQKNRKNGSDPEPTQKHQNPGEVSKVELTYPRVTYLLPIAYRPPKSDIFWISTRYLLDIDSISIRYLLQLSPPRCLKTLGKETNVFERARVFFARWLIPIPNVLPTLELKTRADSSRFLKKD